MQENTAITQKKSKERQIQTVHPGGWDTLHHSKRALTVPEEQSVTG